MGGLEIGKCETPEWAGGEPYVGIKFTWGAKKKPKTRFIADGDVMKSVFRED